MGAKFLFCYGNGKWFPDNPVLDEGLSLLQTAVPSRSPGCLLGIRRFSPDGPAGFFFFLRVHHSIGPGHQLVDRAGR